MAAEQPRLESRSDIEAQIVAMRAHGRHIAPVRWQDAPAWLKLAVPEPPAWRYQIQGIVARLLGLSALQPVRPRGGAAGIGNEAARLDALAAAGVHVPQVLAHGGDWLLISEIGYTTLESLIRHASGEARLAHWRAGAAYIHGVHAAGQYLGQPFARNLVWSPEGGLGAIDFEDDPLTVMSLDEAQMRDWMPYFFSTAVYFEADLPMLCAEIEAVLTNEARAVRDGVARLMRRTAWVAVARRLPRALRRRDVVKTACYGELGRHCRRHAARV